MSLFFLSLVFLFCVSSENPFDISNLFDENRWNKHVVGDYLAKNAVCNDKSPYTYFVKKGSSSKYLFWLMGGGWCVDKRSCDQRSPLFTSSYWALNGEELKLPSKGLEYLVIGMFTDNPSINPILHEYTHVILHYCSSDAWTGNTTAYFDPNFEFRGRNNLYYSIDEIINNVIVPGRKGSEERLSIVLSGSSAGGYGIMQAADDLKSDLFDPYFGQDKYDIRLIIDSAMLPSVAPLSPEANPFPPLDDQFRYGVQVWNAVLNRKCSERFDIWQRWRCLMGDTIMREFMQMKTLCVQDMLDSVVLKTGIGAFIYPEEEIGDHIHLLSNKDHRKFALEALQKSRVMFKNFPSHIDYALTGCVNHLITTTYNYWKVSLHGQSIVQILAGWMMGQDGKIKMKCDSLMDQFEEILGFDEEFDDIQSVVKKMYENEEDVCLSGCMDLSWLK